MPACSAARKSGSALHAKSSTRRYRSYEAAWGCGRNGSYNTRGTEFLAKDATIQLHQTTIERQRQMLTGEIVLESMKDITPKPKDSEEVLGGLVEITKYEGKGFKLNLLEAFRRLRNMFSEKKGGKG